MQQVFDYVQDHQHPTSIPRRVYTAVAFKGYTTGLQFEEALWLVVDKEQKISIDSDAMCTLRTAFNACREIREQGW